GVHLRVLLRDPALSSRVPLPDSRRVLKTRKDSDSHPPPSTGGGLPGFPRPRFQIPIGKEEREKRKKRTKDKTFLSPATRLAQQKLFTNSKFCIILLALIPVMNYNA